MAFSLNKDFFSRFKKSADQDLVDINTPLPENSPEETSDSEQQAKPEKVQEKPKPALAYKLAGENRYFPNDIQPFLPSELVGGSIPYVAGTESEAVWNAAAQACATEKVHYVYSIDGDRVWYLACPSSALASAPDTWCPMAAALPGNSEYWDKETVYIYEKDGLASAMRWDKETGRMQIFLGASRTILPRVQSMDANFITINPQVANIVMWRNRQLRSELLARATARMLVASGIVVSLLLIAFLFIQYVAVNFVDRKLSDVQSESEKASMQLLTKSVSISQNEVLKYTVRLQQLLDDLEKIDGTLVRFEVKNGKMEWEALVPAAYSTGVMSVKGRAQPGIEGDGRIRIKGTS